MKAWPTTIIPRVWHALGSIHLTVALCLLLTGDMIYGYFCLHGRSTLFAPLNEVGLTAWLTTYGRYNLSHTLWFIMLLALLLLLGVNTFVCTTERVVGLLKRRAQYAPRRFLFKFAPHLMHYALILLLCGYLSTYLFARVLDTRTLLPGASLNLPGTSAQITFETFDPVYYTGGRLVAFENRVLRPRAHLLLTRNGAQQRALLGCNRPVRFAGYGIFLKNFTPKKRSGGMARRTRIDVSIRKDPGVPLYLAGMLLFTIGLAIYLVEWMVFKKPQSASGNYHEELSPSPETESVSSS
jgi:hypothetical protein